MTELRVFLVRHGLRQEDLADAVGISRVAVSNLITGKSEPRKATIDAILSYCRSHDPAVTYDQLFGDPAVPEKVPA